MNETVKQLPDLIVTLLPTAKKPMPSDLIVNPERPL
jgi:hypothetical protein